VNQSFLTRLGSLGVPQQRLLYSLPKRGLVHAGAALWYSDVLKGAPPALERQLTRFPALHAVNVVLTVRYVLVPTVFDDERFLIKPLPIPGFYHVIARFVLSTVCTFGKTKSASRGVLYFACGQPLLERCLPRFTA